MKYKVFTNSLKLKFIVSKKIILLSITALTLFAFTPNNPFKELKTGDKAPLADVKMKDISNKTLSLNDIKQTNGLLVIFSCNTCPFVLDWEDRYTLAANLCKENKIGFVLVNSNEAKRSGDDSFKNMQKHAKEKNYSFHYTVDENHALADAFGAKTTPHVFLFNKNLELAYSGSIDDNHKDPIAVREHYLTNAINKVAKGEPANPDNSPAKGCSIKRISTNK
jgi:peroxiredoxin